MKLNIYLTSLIVMMLLFAIPANAVNCSNFSKEVCFNTETDPFEDITKIYYVPYDLKDSNVVPVIVKQKYGDEKYSYDIEIRVRYDDYNYSDHVIHRDIELTTELWYEGLSEPVLIADRSVFRSIADNSDPTGENNALNHVKVTDGWIKVQRDFQYDIDYHLDQALRTTDVRLKIPITMLKFKQISLTADEIKIFRKILLIDQELGFKGRGYKFNPQREREICDEIKNNSDHKYIAYINSYGSCMPSRVKRIK